MKKLFSMIIVFGFLWCSVSFGEVKFLKSCGMDNNKDDWWETIDFEFDLKNKKVIQKVVFTEKGFNYFKSLTPQDVDGKIQISEWKINKIDGEVIVFEYISKFGGKTVSKANFDKKQITHEVFSSTISFLNTVNCK